MTLTVDTTALARRLYERWRQRQDFAAPLSENEPLRTLAYPWADVVPQRRIRARPGWHALTDTEQAFWLDMALEAERFVTASMWSTS